MGSGGRAGNERCRDWVRGRSEHTDWLAGREVGKACIDETVDAGVEGFLL